MSFAQASGDADGCRAELVTAERRGQLSDAGRLALDAHLAFCPSCRRAREVAGAFDAIDVADLHDGARIRALSDAARRARRGRIAPARARMRALAAAAAIVISCGSASAAVWWWRHPPRVGLEPAAASGLTAARVSASSRPSREAPSLAVPTEAALPTVAAGSALPTVAAGPALPTVAPPRRAGHVGKLAFAHASSAPALLREATEARRTGERDRAVELYRRLRRDFAGSPEAVLAAVPLGRLLLETGYPRAALAELDGYLAGAHGGTLIPEALYGRARALAELGDRSEERRTWQRLVADFPGSAYAPLGRRRLVELE